MEKPDVNRLVAIRDYFEEPDKNFVISTWLRGFYHGEDWVREIDKRCFMEAYNLFLNKALYSKRFKVKIACLKEQPDVILGYIATSQDEKVVHWVFVKAAWRKIGIAKLLIPTNVEAVTHLTKAGRAMLRTLPSVKFNPFVM